MDIDTSATIVVGLPYKDLNKELQNTVKCEEYDTDIFSTVSPYYDAPVNACLFGNTIINAGSYSWSKLDDDTYRYVYNNMTITFIIICVCLSIHLK